MRVAGSLAGADDIKLFVVGREAEAIGVRYLILPYNQVDLAAFVDAVHAGRQLAFVAPELRRLPEPWIEPTTHVGWAACRVDRALVELRAIGRIGEPVASVRMRHDGAIQLVADHTSRHVLARKLAALEIERVAVAVVRRCAEHAHMTVVLDPAELAIVRNVAPYKIPALRIPCRTL